MNDSPIRFGVLGLGRAFTLMVPTFALDPRVRVVAGFDPREAPRRRLVTDFGATAYATAEGVCSDPNVEVVYIASPHQFHAEHVQLAARCGKHVLLEKPMALTLEDCDAMIDSCDSAGVHLVVGHCHSFDRPYLETQRMIKSGEYGSPRMIHALDFTDFLYRPRRPEELRTEEGGGVVFSQGAHQMDIVRLLAGANVQLVRAITGQWDPQRPTEGAYAALLWFDNGCFASVVYSGYAHFDSDEWCDWRTEMGYVKNPDVHMGARRRLATATSAQQESELKAASSYGGLDYNVQLQGVPALAYQHFGPVIVSCEKADLRPVPDGVWVYADGERRKLVLPPPLVPRAEVIDELHAALRLAQPPRHDGRWARGTLAVCLALLSSTMHGRDMKP